MLNRDVTHSESGSSDTISAPAPVGRQSLGPLWVRGVVRFVEVGSVLLLAYLASLAVTNYLAVQSWSLPLAPSGVLGGVSKATPSSSNGALAFDPFYRAVSEPTKEQVRAAPESSLKLTIYGLRAEADGQGSAILNQTSGGQKLYHIGDEVQRGITLHSVYSDRIEIDRSGLLETVYMATDRRKSLQKPASKNEAVVSAADTGGSYDIKAIMAGLNLQPFRERGKLRGFIIGENADSAGLEALDLHAGDIILSIAGEKLISFERLQELNEQIDGKNIITIEYERLGEERTQNVRVK